MQTGFLKGSSVKVSKDEIWDEFKKEKPLSKLLVPKAVLKL